MSGTLLKQLLAFFCVACLMSVHGCGQDKSSPQKELLVYCGITMIKPMTEIASMIEKEKGCRIIITKGGSGNLLKSIKTNMLGDLYLPGCEFYVEACKKDGLVTESVHVGYNKPAMMTQKGNPWRIQPELSSMANPDYYVVIGNPESGSIGRETKRVLEKRGIYDQVVDNAKFLTTDSKDLVRVLKDNEADLVINWYATSTWSENRDAITVLPIDDKYASKNKLVLGLLKFSKHPEIARSFMALASSDEGRDIFNKYGLYDVR